MKKITAVVKSFLREEDGVTAVEYGLIAGFISVVIIAGLETGGPAIERIFDSIGGALEDAAPAAP